jgi:hypothetical protein
MSDASTSMGTDTGDTIDPRYELIRAAGPSLTEDKKYDISVPGTLWETKYPFQNLPPFPTDSQSLLQQNPATKQLQSQFSFNSQNRDTSQYPYSSYMKIMLPRVYKNVSSFNVVQIAFPNLNGVIPDNTGAAEAEIESAIIKTIFDLDGLFPNTNPNLCEPQPTTTQTDIVNEIVQFRFNPTKYLKPYDYCLSYQLAASFLGVSSCLDTVLINEVGRVNPGDGGPLYLAYNIPPGRYIPSSIVLALNNSMNSSSYFSLYDYDSYTSLIKSGKGAIIGFAFPNLTYYNNLVEQYITSDVTRETIGAFYYPNINTIFSKPPTVQEIFVSYYYPALKETLISPILRYLINYLNYDIIEVYNDSVLKFLGLNYKMYVDLCTANEKFLSIVRQYYTQKYYAVNVYNWYFNTDKNRIGVTFNAINSSISTTVNNEYSENFQASLIYNDITQEDYDNANQTLNSGTSGLPVIQSMATFFSEQLGLNLGVTLVDYSLDDVSNNYTLYNTENIVALLPGYQLQQPPAGYVNQTPDNQFSGIWPKMREQNTETWEFFQDQVVPFNFRFTTMLNTSSGPVSFTYNSMGQYVYLVESTFNPRYTVISPPIDASMNHSFNIDTNSFLTVDTFNNNNPILAINSSNQIQNVNNIFNDVTAHIPSGKYVIIPFNVPTTQNVQIMTLPRPYLYRYPNYNNTKQFILFNGVESMPTLNTFPGVPFMFNYNYSNFSVDPKYLVIDNPNIINLQNIDFTSTLNQALNLSVFSPSYTLNFMTPQQFFQIIPPQTFNSSQTFVGQRYETNLTILPQDSATFNTDIDILIYLDFSQFCADMANTYSNDPYFWKYKLSIKQGDVSGTINFPVYSNYGVFDSSGNFFVNQQPYPPDDIFGNFDTLNFVPPNTIIDDGNIAFVIYNPIFLKSAPYKPFWVRVHYPNTVSQPQSFKIALWGQTNRIDIYADFINPTGPNIPLLDFNQYTWNQVYASGLYNGEMSYYYTSTLDPDFAGANPINQRSPSSLPFNSLVPMTQPFIGRDKNGISTDLTDYRAFSINPIDDTSGNNRISQFRGDPITGYYFKVSSTYSDTEHSYFYPGSLNAVYTPNNKIYTFTSTQSLDREFKLTHWLHQYYFPPQYNLGMAILIGDVVSLNANPSNQLSVFGLGDAFPNLSGLVHSRLSILPNVQPTCPAGLNYGVGVYPPVFISEYYPYPPFSNYIGMFNNNPGSRFSSPIIGFTFNLPDGVYNLKRLTFKSAYIGSDIGDPNNYNNRLYVFNAADIYVKPFSILLNNPLAILRPATSVPWRSTFDPSGNRQFAYSSDYDIDSSGVIRIVPKLLQNIPNTGTMIDNQYGTYYTFEIDEDYATTQFRGTSLPTGSPQINDYGNYCFCVVSDFQDISSSLFFFGNIWLLAGSVVPNPDYSIVDPVNNSFEPNAQPPLVPPNPPYKYQPWPSTNGNIFSPYTGEIDNNAYLIPKQIATPSYNSASLLESQYEQSMPINTIGIVNGSTPYPDPGLIDPAGNILRGNVAPTFSIQYNYFWPVQNIVFNRVATSYKSMIELNNIINPAVPQDTSGQFEVGRTQMFIYDSLDNFFTDTKSTVPVYDNNGNQLFINGIPQTQTVYNWGSESHYINADTKFNGYYSNSYISNFIAEENKTYYLALRAFSPAEDFQCLIRFQASQQTQVNVVDTSPSTVDVSKTSKELYTFGLKTTDMISNEYFLYNLAKLTSFTPDYATSIVNFYQAFNGNFVFGLNNFLFDGFENVLPDQSANNYFISEYRNLLTAIQPAFTLLNDVDTYAFEQTNIFINKYYKGILPDNLLNYNTLAENTNLPVTFYGKNLAIQSSNPFQIPDPNCVEYQNIVGNILTRITNQFSCFPAGATIPTVEVQLGFPFDTITGTAYVEGQNNNIINQNFYIQFNPDLPQINQLDVALTERPISNNVNQICPTTNINNSTSSGLTAKQYTQNLINTTLQATNYVSREFMGSSQIVYGKIIANNSVDNITQTLLAGQVTFDPPIGKLDHLAITIFTQDLYPVYQVYPYITPELEWNSIISITENISQVPTDNITQVARIDLSGASLPF